jgi:hypothetical protein
MKKVLSVLEFARMGGKARAQKLTAAQRLASSRKATRALKRKARERRRLTK